MDRTKDVDIPWYSEMAGMGANLVNEDYSKWTINQGKVDRLLDQISKTSNETLGMLQVVNSKVNKKMYDMLKEQRNVIIQRMTLLKVAEEIGTFCGEYQAELPTITGENTADIIARVNEKLGIEITEGEVVTSPNDVDSLIEQLKKENPDNEDRYDEAINNK